MLTTKLYPYQEAELERLSKRKTFLLAWETGLGKTLACIASAEALLQSGRATTCLLVVPASLIMQWAEAIAKHTDYPTREVVVSRERFVVPAQDTLAIIDGTPKQKKRAFYDAYKQLPPYIICSYQTVVNWHRWVRKLKPQFMAIDEASQIKSFDSARSKAVKRMQPEYRIAMTATPVENSPLEFYSIMQWLDYTVFGSWEMFEPVFVVRDFWDNIVGWDNLDLFFNKVSGVMSRKGREDPEVAPYVPDLDEGEWYVDLDTRIGPAYNRIATDLRNALGGIRGSTQSVADLYAGTSSDENTPLGRVMARQLALEMLLCHPDLVVNSALDYAESLAQQRRGVRRASWPGSKYAYDIWQEGALDSAYDSAKLAVLKRRVNEILERDPDAKIIIFSRFKYMLAIIDDELSLPSVQYHGDMGMGARSSAVQRFSVNSSVPLFLSSHAGAYGVDIPAANWLINYDLPWSSGKADQINGRHQRAASNHELVYVRNLITANTIEERKLELLAFKRSLAQATVDGKLDGTDGRIYNDLSSLAEWLEEL